MYRKSVLLLAGIPLLIVCVGYMTAQDRGTKDKRAADKQAIDKIVKDSVAAFDKRDAAAITAHWTDEGEFIRNDGEPIRGKAAIQKGYADFFKTATDKSKLEIQLDGLRFTSADSAVSEVTLRLKNELGEITASSWRNTLLVREGGQWKVAIVQEWDRDVGLDVTLKDLDWLIGTWQVSSKGREVTTSYEWNEAKTFINGKYSVKEGDKVVESGTQKIGKDNASGAIHSWVFQSDGGFGDGAWTREGNKWRVAVRGVTPAGNELTATAIYVHLDADTYTWQSVDQAVDGNPIPDTKPIKISRKKKN